MAWTFSASGCQAALISEGTTPFTYSSSGSSLIASSLPFCRLTMTRSPTVKPLIVSSPSRPRTSRRSDLRGRPSTISPDGPAVTVIRPFESTVSFGARTIRPEEDATVTDSTFWKMAIRMVSPASARAGARTGADSTTKSSARAAVVHARVMLFPEQKPGQQAQDDARQDSGGDGEVKREVVTLDQDVAGELADRAEHTGEASGQDENGPHQHDRDSDPDQNLAEAAQVRRHHRG